MTKFYLTYDVITWTWKKPRAIMIVNNYLIKFVNSNIMFNAFELLNNRDWYIYDDRLTMTRILYTKVQDLMLQKKQKQDII